MPQSPVVTVSSLPTRGVGYVGTLGAHPTTTGAVAAEERVSVTPAMLPVTSTCTCLPAMAEVSSKKSSSGWPTAVVPANHL